jgi:hypothetical protein
MPCQHTKFLSDAHFIFPLKAEVFPLPAGRRNVVTDIFSSPPGLRVDNTQGI